MDEKRREEKSLGKERIVSELNGKKKVQQQISMERAQLMN